MLIFLDEDNSPEYRRRHLLNCLHGDVSDAHRADRFKSTVHVRRLIAEYFNDSQLDINDFMFLYSIESFKYMPIDPNVMLFALLRKAKSDQAKVQQCLTIIDRIVFTSEAPSRTLLQLVGDPKFINAGLLMRFGVLAMTEMRKRPTLGTVTRVMSILDALVQLAYDYFVTIMNDQNLWHMPAFMDLAGGNRYQITELDLLFMSGLLTLFTNRSLSYGFRDRSVSGYVFHIILQKYIRPIAEVENKDPSERNKALLARRYQDVLDWKEHVVSSESSGLKMELHKMVQDRGARDWWYYTVHRIDESQLLYSTYFTELAAQAESYLAGVRAALSSRSEASAQPSVGRSLETVTEQTSSEPETDSLRETLMGFLSER